MLAPRQVVVFLARPETLLTEDGRAAALAVLTDDERMRLDRFRFDRDRDVALASRAVQRRALSSCADVAPSAWRFAPEPSGRPRIVAPALRAPLVWNVANTVGLVACAVTHARALGLDVEPRRRDAPAEVVASHFAPAEQAGLRALPPADQPRRFVELWTLKEAYVKARSLGLSAPLAQFAVDPSAAPPGLVALPGDRARWQVAQWWPTADHCAALCVERDDDALDLDVRWL